MLAYHQAEVPFSSLEAAARALLPFHALDAGGDPPLNMHAGGDVDEVEGGGGIGGEAAPLLASHAQV